MGLDFSRGNKTRLKVPELSLVPGKVYAISGPNGSGKSSLIKVMKSCADGKLDSSFTLHEHGNIAIPSSVEVISQKFYCPLHIKPIEWLLQKRVENIPESMLDDYESRIISLFKELKFYSSESGVGLSDERIREALHKIESDWYNILSGGQKSKIAFMKGVFLLDTCPAVVFIDETFGPLDAEAKQITQDKIRDKCSKSVVAVVHHLEAGETCVKGGGFFDQVIQIGNETHIVELVGVC